MKPNVLLATPDRQLGTRFRDEVADLCQVRVSVSSGTAYAYLRRESFQVFIVDAKLPRLDSIELAHALWHAPAIETLVSWGPMDRIEYLRGTERREPVVVRRSFQGLVKTVRALLDPTAARTLDAVRYLPKEETFFVAFRSGKTYELSRKLVNADDGSPILGAPRLINDGDAFEVRQKSGKTYAVPWDFVLHHHEPSYPYHKRQTGQREVEARGAERIATRIRREREARGWSLGELARRTGMRVPNLSRLESGKHMPSLDTLERMSQALGVRLADLVAA
jgi:DNA-binding Xre family transcriptional regulator